MDCNKPTVLAAKALTDALSMLETVDEDQEPEDTPPPDGLVKNVESLIRRLYGETELPTGVLAMPEGDIVLCTTKPGRKYDMVYIQCNVKGNAYCLSVFGSEETYEYYDSIEMVPDQFVTEALDRLARSGT